MNRSVFKKVAELDIQNTELSEVQVELAIVDDIKKLSSDAEKSVSTFLKAYTIISTQKQQAIADGEMYYKNAAKLETSIKQFEAQASQLGIDPNGSKEYKTAKDLLTRYDIQGVYDRVDSLRKLK
jgi:hypothetical protein